MFAFDRWWYVLRFFDFLSEEAMIPLKSIANHRKPYSKSSKHIPNKRNNSQHRRDPLATTAVLRPAHHNAGERNWNSSEGGRTARIARIIADAPQ